MEPHDYHNEGAVYRAILTSMGEGIIFADHNDRIVCVNAAAEQIRGSRPQIFSAAIFWLSTLRRPGNGSEVSWPACATASSPPTPAP